jgi:hypothetical protein
MTFKSLALAAVTATLLSGAALAQTDNPLTPPSGTQGSPEPQTQTQDAMTPTDQTTTQSTGTQGSPEPQTQALMDDKTKMAPFYTDEAMTTMKTGEEFRSAFNAMSAEDQQRLRDECLNSTSQRDEFCEGIKNIQ